MGMGQWDGRTQLLLVDLVSCLFCLIPFADLELQGWKFGWECNL
jgi:hypothetical protein